MAEKFNPVLAALALEAIEKRSFVGMGPEGVTQPDPSMMGGGGMPMDPSMMGGGGMPMDPSMMGGMPADPSMMGGMPMDPAMMGGGGGMPMGPSMMGGAPPVDPVMMLEERLGAIESAISSLAMMLQQQQMTAAQPAPAPAPAPAAAEKKTKGGANAELGEKLDKLTAMLAQALGLPDPNAPVQPQMPPAGMPPGMSMPGMGTGATPSSATGAAGAPAPGMEVAASAKYKVSISSAIAALSKR